MHSRNIFSVPVGKVGTQFVWELARLFQHFADCSALEGCALKAAMLMPILSLQRTQFKSRSKEDAWVLEKCLKCWQKGDLDSLLQECRSIQHHLPSAKSFPSSGQFAHCFAKSMMEGKLHGATCLIDYNIDNFPLSLDASVAIAGITSTVKDILLQKHASPRLPKPSVFLPPSDFSAPPFHPSLFDNLGSTLIHHTILRMYGEAGPFGLYVASWKKLFTAFKEASDNLCDSLSAVARKLVISLVRSGFTFCFYCLLSCCPR